MSEGDRSALSRMRCREIMTKNVKTASSSSSLREVAELMRDGDMGAVPVVDELVTLSLNIWAEESGYGKREPNLLGM